MRVTASVPTDAVSRVGTARWSRRPIRQSLYVRIVLKTLVLVFNNLSMSLILYGLVKFCLLYTSDAADE